MPIRPADPPGLWRGRPGPSGLLAGRKHGFLMWVPDLLARSAIRGEEGAAAGSCWQSQGSWDQRHLRQVAAAFEPGTLDGQTENRPRGRTPSSSPRLTLTGAPVPLRHLESLRDPRRRDCHAACPGSPEGEVLGSQERRRISHILPGCGWGIYTGHLCRGGHKHTVLQMWRLRLSRSCTWPTATHRAKGCSALTQSLGPHGPSPPCTVSFFKQENFPSGSSENFHPPCKPFPCPVPWNTNAINYPL